MFVRKIILTAAASLALSSAALAGNTAFIGQSGGYNIASTHQVGRDNTSGTFQSGGYNFATTHQVGRNNTAGIGQSGLYNGAGVYQSSGGRPSSMP